jgi:response regulator RpfG family c-di-GMP phosphodiesterase
VGKVGLLDRILNTKFIELPLGDAQTYRKHCEMGQSSLKILDDLGNVGLIVRSHHEPVGARIVGMVEAFEELISGDYAKESCSPKEAKKVIASNRGKLFCPDLCDHFVTVLDDLLG